MPSVLLFARNFSAGYARPLFSPADLSLSASSVVSLVGPNGTGKSTILKSFAGLLAPQTGNLFLSGEPFERMDARMRARKIASVFTGERIPFGMDVREFVSLGRIPYAGIFDGRSAADNRKIDEALASVRMESFAHRNASELSDGERSRVFLARALAAEPELLLLDEPTAFLDVPNILSLFRLLRELSQTRKLSVLLSTHHLDYAFRFSDRIIALDGKGHVREGLPEELRHSPFLEWANETV